MWTPFQGSFLVYILRAHLNCNQFWHFTDDFHKDLKGLLSEVINQRV